MYGGLGQAQAESWENPSTAHAQRYTEGSIGYQTQWGHSEDCGPGRCVRNQEGLECNTGKQVRGGNSGILVIGDRASPGGLSGTESIGNVAATGDSSSIPGLEDPLEKEIATHSKVLAWRILWTEEPGGLQSMGSQSQTQLK